MSTEIETENSPAMSAAPTPFKVSVVISQNFIEFYHPTHQLRAYLGLKSVKEAFKEFLNHLKLNDPVEFVLSCRLTEKILHTKLGGSVAQVVTAGFEDLLHHRQPAFEKHFTLNPTKAEALGSSDLIFPIHERIASNGDILEALKLEELNNLSMVLKQKKIEKVVLHLLNAHRNPQHWQQTAKHFKENGFTVFGAAPQSGENEIPEWRKNLLDACLYGVQTEIELEIKTALQELGLRSSEIKFVRALESDEGACSTNYGWLRALQGLSKVSPNVCYLGLENWCTLNLNESILEQPSPWGPFSVPSCRWKKMKLQPTSELLIGRNNQAFWSETKSFDPGPMCFGRSLRFMIIDALQASAHWNGQWVTATGKSKIDMTIENFCKTLRLDAGDFLTMIRQNIIDGICIEVGLTFSEEKVVVCGPLAESLRPFLEKRMPSLCFLKPSETNFVESWNQWNHH
jgi:hypothetical protein